MYVGYVCWAVADVVAQESMNGNEQAVRASVRVILRNSDAEGIVPGRRHWQRASRLFTVLDDVADALLEVERLSKSAPRCACARK